MPFAIGWTLDCTSEKRGNPGWGVLLGGTLTIRMETCWVLALLVLETLRLPLGSLRLITQHATSHSHN